MTIPVSIWFLVLMVFVGGFIAYAGDAIGRNVGKKRRSVGRLRPKHTAMVATFIAGMLGTLATIFILSTVSKPVQRWILEGDQARHDLARVRGELEEQREKLDESRELATALERELGTTTNRLTETSQQLQSAEALRQESHKRNEELTRRSEGLSTKVQQFGVRVQSLASTIEEYKQRSTELAEKNEKAQARYTRLTGENTLIQEQNITLVAEAADLERKLKEANREYEALQQDRNELQAALNSLNDKFDAQSVSYQQQITEAEQRLAATNRALQTQQEALETLQNYASIIEGKSGTARNNPIIYAAGDELARAEIPASPNQAELDAALDSLITRARAGARARGAVVSSDGNYAGLPYDHRNSRSMEEQLRDLQRVLMRLTQPQLLIARTQLNWFRGDTVLFIIEVHEIRQIYAEGEVVLNIQVDGRKTAPQLVTDIAQAISKELPVKLQSDGMLPVSGSAEPFGSITSEQIINLALEIKEYGRPIRVQLVAQENTRNSDRIKLTPRLRP